MRRLILGLLLAIAACTPDIANTPPTDVIEANFDPTATVPVVPTPNDLATNPATGLLAASAPPGSSAIDKDFYAYLDTLDGFPTDSPANVTFSGALDPASVTATSVRVLDLDSSSAAVTVTAVYADTSVDGGTGGSVTIEPPATGWTVGHRYAVAVVGGDTGVKGKDGRAVVASPTWSLVRVSSSLVTCTDLTSADCRPTTQIIPSSVTGDAAARLADQTKSAIALEQLRLKYKPVVDTVIASGVSRDNVALAWTFKVASAPTFVFNPAATPPQVPAPTNLVLVGGLLHIPVDPTSSAAYQEFTTDYLNTLDGYPVSATATAAISGGDLDPASVSTAAFAVLPLKGGALSGAPTFTWDATGKEIVITPAGGSWGKGKTIAIAALAGSTGLKGANGKALQASDVWAFARSASTLVDCDTLGPTCKSVVAAAPLTDAQAIALEGLRRGYKPVLDALTAAGHARGTVVGLWVFSTVDQPEVTFDLAAATPVIPFPANQFLRTTDDIASGHLTFPAPAGPTQALFLGLNTLDGFSTTAPIVSENSDTLTALSEGNIDASTLDAGVGFAKFDGAGPLSPVVKACLNCTSSGTTAQPELLEWVPQRPLEEKSRYGAWVTTAVTDTTGKHVTPSGTFALVRLKNSLLDANNKSTVPVVSDAQAAALEPYRLRFKGCLDKMEAAGVARKTIALGFCVTTQSTVSTVQTLAGVIGSALNPTPNFPTMLLDTTTPTFTAMDALSIPRDGIGHVMTGTMVVPWGLNTATGTLNPDPTAWGVRKMLFTLFLPPGTETASYPVTIFGHGLGRNRNDTMAIANAFAKGGMATLAIDVVFHGDRSSCAGAASVISVPGATDDYACADPVNQKCDEFTGRCVARTPSGAADCTTGGDAYCFGLGKGLCQITGGANPGKCEEADFGRNTDTTVKISAWNYLNLVNLFATRDNFRYTGSIDFTSLVRMVKASGGTSLNVQLAAQHLPTLDGTTINYAGQSLGSFNGTVFGAASPAAKNLALNVPGSSQVDVLLTAPSFAAQRTGFLGGLAALGLTPGSPGFDQFLVLARTILDPADPQNLGYAAVNSSNVSRNVYFQSIEGDTVLPNPTTDLLVNAASQNADRQPQVFRFAVGSAGTLGQIPASFVASSRHGFLLTTKDNNDQCNPLTASCATVVAQTKVTTFLVTGVAP